jgi:hypothetical protein
VQHQFGDEALSTIELDGSVGRDSIAALTRELVSVAEPLTIVSQPGAADGRFMWRHHEASGFGLHSWLGDVMPAKVGDAGRRHQLITCGVRQFQAHQ